MSEQFTFDQPFGFNWCESASLKSIKNLSFTMSDASKNEFVEIPIHQESEQEWNIQEFNKKADKKTKNRENVKNFRQRKKKEAEKMQQKLRHLQTENRMLRQQKFCRNCKKPFGGFVQICETQTQIKKQSNKQISANQSANQGKQCFEFQKPLFYRNNQKQISNRNGKIWIALGMLMLVIGVHLYGFKGKDGYQDISISKIQSEKLIKMYTSKTDPINDYFDVKVKVKPKDQLKQYDNRDQLFRQIRIFHQEQNQQKSKQYKQMARQTIQKLEMIEENNQKQFKSHYNQLETQQQHEVKFHKEFLYAIQAEIDDVGNYL